ncbi:phosphatase [Actinomadura parmotrematis]|uniref:Phosphatase n=1 Tax=Actinomadura parmotrematis TaxID=2864039 RepID=A0ABS7FY11_9ACTN|nr:phosphatase [Actinomadura parmotrematis]MBW8485020.1 phosphatase [Actinomadura parmotrematis]
MARPGRRAKGAGAPSRDELRAHLVRTMIAGGVATPRQNNLLHFRRLAAGDPYYAFGLEFKRGYTEREILEIMVERCGVDPDPRHVYGDDTIDPDLTIGALDRMAARIGAAAEARSPVVVATGHPATLTEVYQAVARALAARGCAVLTPADGWEYEVDRPYGGTELRRLVYAPGGVAMLEGDDGRTHHTHDPAPMERMLAVLAAESGQWPDLAIADHGWAGAAGQAGVDAVGFADCNDPALFVGEAEGRIVATVPLDDGVSPQHYRPLTAYLLERSGLG